MEDNKPDHEDVARRAYELYLERGGQPGHEMRDWLDAESELAGEIPLPGEEASGPSSGDEVTQASMDSFPASDAPSWRSGATKQEQG